MRRVAPCALRAAGASDGDSPLRLLIGVDNSPYSNAAVEAVCQREWPKGTEVRLLAVVDTVMAITPDPSQPAGEVDRSRRRRQLG